MEFRQQTLDNGLEVVAECNPQAYSTAIAFFVKTGARDETPEIAGVSHFLEHMVFKGTPTRTAEDVNRTLDEIGSHSNAFTSEEQTVFFATVLPEYQGHAVELLGDIMRPALREHDFETEKQVILEEIAKYDDQPPFGANEKCMAAHFPQHPLGQSVLGTCDSVTALTADQMRGYFEERYSPQNMALVAAGNVDFDRLVEQASQSCGQWKPFPTQRETPRAQAHSGLEIVQHSAAHQEYVVQIANGPAAEDSNRYAGRLLATILGDDSGSRLFWELVDTGLAEYASIAAYEFQGTGIFMTFLCCAPGDTSRNLERVREIELELESGGVRPEELQQAQNKISAHLILQSERSTNRMFSVGNHWIQRHEYRTVRDIINAYQEVTCDQLASLIQQYPLSASTTVVVGPHAELEPS